MPFLAMRPFLYQTGREPIRQANTSRDSHSESCRWTFPLHRLLQERGTLTHESTRGIVRQDAAAIGVPPPNVRVWEAVDLSAQVDGPSLCKIKKRPLITAISSSVPPPKQSNSPRQKNTADAAPKSYPST
jgi:hypothetical protein